MTFRWEWRPSHAREDWAWNGEAVDPPPRIRNYTHSALETTVKDQSGYYYADPQEWLSYTDPVQGIASSMGSSPLGRLEKDECSKMVCWRRVPRGSLIIPGGFKNTDNGSLEQWRTAIRHVLALYTKRARGVSWALAAKDGSWTPLNKHKGYPDHTSGYYPLALQSHLRLTAACLLGERTVEQVRADLADKVGLDMYCTQFVRISGTSKWITGYEFDGNWLQPQEERKRYWARSRTVFGQSFWHNVLARRYMGMLKALLRAQPQHDLTPDGQRRQLTRLWHIAASGRADSQDAKGYDTSLGKELQILAGQEMVRWVEDVWPEGAEAVGTHCLGQVLTDFAEMNMLGPRVSTEKEAFLWTRRGTLSSGRSDTSVLGTLLKTAHLWLMVRDLSGLSLHELETRLGLDWDYMIWGDDTVVAAPQTWLPDAGVFYGIEVESMPGIIVFLAKNWLPDGTSHALVSRMYINTINKEVRNEPRDEIVAVLGYRVRQLLLRAHPQGYLYREMMMSRPRTAAIARLGEQLSDNEIQSKLMRYIAERKLDSVTLENLQQDLSDAGYDNPLIEQAIADALGQSHAFGYWQDEVDMSLDISTAVNNLYELGQEAPR